MLAAAWKGTNPRPSAKLRMQSPVARLTRCVPFVLSKSLVAKRAFPTPMTPLRVLSDTCQKVVGGGASGQMQEWRLLLEKAESSPEIVNLTQGYPDFAGSATARREAAEAIAKDGPNKLNQYSPLVGLSSLMESLSKFYKRVWNMDVDAKREILVTTSGTEAISIALQALVSPGEEVVVFEPCFPWYLPVSRLAGGEVKLCKLSMEDEYAIDAGKLEASFDPKKTKVIIVNSPHNPTGRVLSESDIETVHRFASTSEVGCVIFSDEAYEGQCWAKEGHVKIKVLVDKLNEKTGSKVRVVTMGTASKLCSLTGWRVGWLLGDEDIISGCKALHGYSTYCAPSPLQHGIAKALDEFTDQSFDGTRDMMESNARKVVDALRGQGFNTYNPEGGYFVVADGSPLGFSSNMELCQVLIDECKVAVAPMNMFYGTPAPELTPSERGLVRIAICKTEPVIQEAIARIRKLSPPPS